MAANNDDLTAHMAEKAMQQTTPRRITADEVRVGQTIRVENECSTETGTVASKDSPGSFALTSGTHFFNIDRLGWRITLLSDPLDRDGEVPGADDVRCPECTRRPEPVVKAEALREIADITVGELAGRTIHPYCRDKADELDPPRPAEPTGRFARALISSGVYLRWDSDEEPGTPWMDTQGERWSWMELTLRSDGTYLPVTVLSEGVTE